MLHPNVPVVTVSDLPRRFGVQDAKHGVPCVPELYFTRHADKVAYCQGYASIAGHNQTTRQFLSEVAR
jgi:hypothetical protein